MVLTSADPSKGLSCAKRVETAGADDRRIYLTSVDSAKEDNKAKRYEADTEGELSSGSTPADSTARLNWTERAEAPETEKLDFSLVFKWADEEEGEEENDTLDSRLSMVEKVYKTEAMELEMGKTNSEDSCRSKTSSK